MNVMIDFCIVPIGVGVSVSKYVVECQKILDETGLRYKMHSYGTSVEGEWEAVFSALKACHERVHALGVPRIHTTMRVGTRVDRDQTMQDKLDSIARQLDDEG